ncbi:MAG: hypothetical protein ACREJR_05525 [Candidatus Rokuibacteriota bacterium]
MKKSRRFLTPLVLFTLAGWALWVLGRNEPASSTDAETDSREPRTTSPAARPRATWSKRRLATSLAFATLFFGGAAFSAGAGGVVAEALEGSETATEVTSTEEAPTEEPAPSEEEGEQPAADGEEPAEGGEEPADEGEQSAEGGEQPSDGGGETPDDGEALPPPPLPDAPGDDDDTPEAPKPSPGVGDGPGNDPPPPSLPVIDKETRSPANLDPEAEADGFFATIWLHRPLPDPTPPAKRLKPDFARGLARESARARVDWALVLGVLRARGFDGTSLSLTTVRSTARRLADLGARRHPRMALRAYGGPEFGDEAFALRTYNRAVGLRALVRGFEASKPSLRRLVLRDKRLDIYPGGRLDVAMGRTDVRVLVLLRYLAVSHGQATVSSLTTGHRYYSRPGVVSAHSYGLAVDVAALDDTSIYGNQQPGGVTERGVENILRLPSELQPKQVISLLSMGGPSFAMADHHDHIHVGY